MKEEEGGELARMSEVRRAGSGKKVLLRADPAKTSFAKDVGVIPRIKKIVNPG